MTATAIPIRVLPGDYTSVMSPLELRKLGHKWSDINRWGMNNPVRWDKNDQVG